MTEFDYQMIWFIATAVMTVAVLTVGTLKAAELSPSRKRTTAKAQPPTSHDEWPAARDERPEASLQHHRHSQHAA